MRPVTRQCSATGWPPTSSVPAAMVLVAVIVVLASVPICAPSVAQSPLNVAGCAAPSCGNAGAGGASSSSESPQPPSARSASAAEASAARGGMRTTRAKQGRWVTKLSPAGARPFELLVKVMNEYRLVFGGLYRSYSSINDPLWDLC